MQSQMPLYPEQASNFAPQVDNLVLFMIAVCLFFAVAICSAVIYFFFKYQRKHPDEIGVPIHGDLRLGLVDASQGKIGTPVDKMLLFCFQYDPSTARYSATILGIMRVLALMTIAGLLLMIVIYRRRDKRAASRNLSHQGAD